MQEMTLTNTNTYARSLNLKLRTSPSSIGRATMTHNRRTYAPSLLTSDLLASFAWLGAAEGTRLSLHPDKVRRWEKGSDAYLCDLRLENNPRTSRISGSGDGLHRFSREQTYSSFLLSPHRCLPCFHHVHKHIVIILCANTCRADNIMCTRASNIIHILCFIGGSCQRVEYLV